MKRKQRKKRNSLQNVFFHIWLFIDCRHSTRYIFHEIMIPTKNFIALDTDAFGLHFNWIRMICQTKMNEKKKISKWLPNIWLAHIGKNNATFYSAFIKIHKWCFTHCHFDYVFLQLFNSKLKRNYITLSLKRFAVRFSLWLTQQASKRQSIFSMQKNIAIVISVTALHFSEIINYEKLHLTCGRD